MKDKIKSKIEEIKKMSFKTKIKYIFVGLILAILPIVLEILLFKNSKLDINKSSIIRIGYIYGIYILYLIYKVLDVYSNKLKKLFDFILKHRYIIAIIFFCTMVLLKLNISNIGAWRMYIEPEEKSDTTLIGINRYIRSDEWEVQTPFFFAQSLNNEKYYPLENNNIADGQNMLMIYPAPVWNITIIGKPQNLGFLLFGKDYGYSWYWCMKIVLLVLLSIEICMILTNKNSFLSIIGGIWLAYSPSIQWWLSSNGDIYIHAFAIIVLFHYYVNNTDWKLWKKLLIAIGMISSIAGFVFCFYPPVQIPIAYVMLVFLLVDYIINFKKIKLEDYIIILVTLAISFAIIGYYLIVSVDAISLIMNTVYPGSRDLTGGDANISVMIKYFFNIFSIRGRGLAEVGTNQAEVSAVIYPFIALIIGIVYKFKDFKVKIKDRKNWLCYGLCLVYIILMLWNFVGFGNILSKVSLLFLCQPERVFLILGIIGLMLCLIILNQKEIKLQKCQIIIISLFVIILANALIYSFSYNNYFTNTKKLILYSIIFLMTYNLLSLNSKGFSYVIFIITIATGITINPLNVGTDAIFGTNTSKQIIKILNEDAEDNLWIGNSSRDSQFLIANGARVLNGVNYYPNFDMLYILDPEKKYEYVYNRYAHIEINLTKNKETEFILMYPDAYRIQLSKEDFEELGIKYYYSSKKIDEDIEKLYNLKLIFNEEYEGKYIYSVI